MNKEKTKNKIICISGQPVSGKGTVTKSLVEKLQQEGYEKNNIHVITTGERFREYFNTLIDFIEEFDKMDIKVFEKIKTNELKQILNNKEYRTALIDTIFEIKSKGIDLSKISIEEINNIDELRKIRNVIDTIIDSEMEQKGKEINQTEKPDEIWLIDSRLAFFNIPEAFSVRLTSNPEVAGERLLNDKKRGKEDNQYKNLQDSINAREKRKIGEQKRYKERYNMDLEDENNYDLIIDTSYSKTEDISDTILKCLDYYMKDKEFAKKWTSPKTLLPLQNERETFSKALFSFEEILESIEEKGYMPDKPIDAVEVDGYKYIIEGHHRNFASAYLGKTLVPYEILAKDDEEIHFYGRNTARQRASALNRSYLYGHEAIIANQDPKFSYQDIYPGIYDMLKTKQNERYE